MGRKIHIQCGSVSPSTKKVGENVDLQSSCTNGDPIDHARYKSVNVYHLRRGERHISNTLRHVAAAARAVLATWE
jgi:hypothetical protein